MDNNNQNNKQIELTVIEKFGCAGLASIFTTTLVNPLEVLKTHMHVLKKLLNK